MELNREQIIKALGICSTTGDCPNCYYNDDTSLCINRILKDALSLIKELTEENERLRDELAKRPPKLVITKLPEKESKNV